MKKKYTKLALSKLEDKISKLGFGVRYEKGSFQSGHCLIHEKRLILVNKFFDVEGKINVLETILGDINMDSKEEE